MLAHQLINNNYPFLNLSDKVSLALKFMDDFDVQHLPVVADEKYVGLISKDDLLDVEEESSIEALEDDLVKKSVKGSEHFFSALKLSATMSISIVPVVSETGELLGAIPYSELVKGASSFLSTEEPGALIVLEMERKHYSFGEISRLIETNDAYITQLNTLNETETGLLIVTIKVNKLEVSAIIATFQRYEYSIRYFIGEEDYENELRFNYDHLMSYLKM
ncbi:MAG: CBS domain-containing protein [Chitinophagaceae bacterium]|nr:CBS domain-containing protein [Chitinophagaceae bacterium]